VVGKSGGKVEKKFKEITMETGNELGLIECKLK
jgi:hypothetical protein